jgi:hypothetical protein
VIDCEVIPPPTQWRGHEGEARPPIPAEWAPTGEGAAANLLEYCWSRDRGHRRDGGRGAQGSAAAGQSTAPAERGHAGAQRGSRGQ